MIQNNALKIFELLLETCFNNWLVSTTEVFFVQAALTRTEASSFEGQASAQAQHRNPQGLS